MKQGRRLLVKLERLVVYKCEKCLKVFPNDRDLKKHKSYQEERFLAHTCSAYVAVERVKLFKCDKCTQIFRKNKEFLLHKLLHLQENVKNERKISKLLNHDIVNPYKCPDCNISYVAQSTLDAHAILHLPFPHICECGIGYYEKEDLKSHFNLVHGRKIKVGTLSQNLDSPQEELKGNMKGTNNKKHKSQQNIIHPKLKIRKTPDNKYKCPKCNKLYTKKHKVFVHYRNHSGERPYTCHLCSKTFMHNCTLKIHVEKHLVKKECHVCKHCPRTFSRREYKERHELIHNAPKHYDYRYRGKGFHDQSAIIRHKRVHKGVKRYRCPYCPKSFSDISTLKPHKLRHENNA